MADEFFKLLGRIEVDNDSLRKSLSESESLVRQSGERLKRIWNQGVTPGRVEGSSDNIRTQGDANGVLSVGGQFSRLSASVFSREGQRATMAAKLAEIGRSQAGSAGGSGGGNDPFNGMAQGAANTITQFNKLSMLTRGLIDGPLGQLAPELGQVASAFTFATRATSGMGVALTAAGGAAAIGAVALTFYISKLKEQMEVQIQLGIATKKGDMGAVAGQAQASADALVRYAANVRIANQEDQSLVAGIQSIIAYWSNFGKSSQQIEANLKSQREALLALYKAQEVPRTAAQAQLDVQKLRQQQIGLDRQMATTTESIDVVTKALTASLRSEAAASRDLILVEKTKLQYRLDQKVITQEQFDLESKEIDRRAKVSGADFEIKEIKAKRDGAKAALDAAVAEITQNQNVKESLESIRSIRRDQFNLVESEGDLETRLTDKKKAGLAGLEGQLKLINEQYGAELLQVELVANANKYMMNNAKATEEERTNAKRGYTEAMTRAAEIEKQYGEESAAQKRRITAEAIKLEAEAAAAREARAQREIAAEEKTQQHRVATGRMSMTDQMSSARLAAVDPRRTLDQQRKAEEDFQNLRISYAQNYFSLYESLGRPQYAAQLDWAKQIAAEQVSGSDKWFQAVRNVANEYQKIHDKAKGLFTTQASIAEAEAKRQGRNEIRPDEVGKYFSQAQSRAQRKRGGASGTGLGLGDMLGIIEAGGEQRMDTRNPGELLAEALKNPAEELAKTIGTFSTSIGTASITSKEGNEAMANLTGSAGMAAKALEDLAAAAAKAAGSVGNQDQGPDPRETVLSTNGGGRSYTNLPSRVSSSLGKMSADEIRRGVAAQADL